MKEEKNRRRRGEKNPFDLSAREKRCKKKTGGGRLQKDSNTRKDEVENDGQ